MVGSVPVANVAEPEVLPRLLGSRYRLEATIGQGGMGAVYRSTDLTTNRPVAVKLLRPPVGLALEDDVAGRFWREAKNTARLQHGNIIEVFDLGRTDGGDLYFVMELLEGESLAERLRREGKLQPALAVHIGRQICGALEVAHAAGMIHRDLKPANIMLLVRDGNEAFVKVLDFGVAKSFGPERHDETQLTHTGMLIGTVDYMAPEQIMGRAVDGRTDVYSLGVMLYRMLAGKPPFAEGGVPNLIHAHVSVLPKPLDEVVAGIPNALGHVVLRCLAKQPDRRYESMAELGRALAHALGPESATRVGGAAHEPDDFDERDATAVGRSVRDPRLLTPDQDATITGGTHGGETVMMGRPFGVPSVPAGRRTAGPS